MVRGVLVGEQILLMTRPDAVARGFVARLEQAALRGVRVIYAPLIQIVPTGLHPDLGGYAGVIFTSANGADAAPKGAGLAAYCVGRRTAQHAAAAGYDVQMTALDADHLVQQITASGVSGPLAHLSGAHTRGAIATRLGALGITVREYTLYDQPLVPLSAAAHDALSGEVPVILPLFSPRTAAHIATQVSAAHRTTVLALSSAVLNELGSVQFAKVEVAAQPTGKDMAIGIEKLLYQNSLS